MTVTHWLTDSFSSPVCLLSLAESALARLPLNRYRHAARPNVFAVRRRCGLILVSASSWILAAGLVCLIGPGFEPASSACLPVVERILSHSFNPTSVPFIYAESVRFRSFFFFN